MCALKGLFYCVYAALWFLRLAAIVGLVAAPFMLLYAAYVETL